MLLEDGIKALQQQQFSQAVELLEDYCKRIANKNTPNYIQAQIALARAYRGNNQREQAFTLGQALQKHHDPQVSEWAKGFISILIAEEKATNTGISSGLLSEPKKPLRTLEPVVRLPLPKAKFYLQLAFYLTGILMFVLVCVFCLIIITLTNFNIYNRVISTLGLSFIISLITFFSSPLIIDLIAKTNCKIQWINLSQVRKYSPETANVISYVVRKQKIQAPRLGIIDDANPIVFTYGVLPNQARIVITKGLLKYLKDEEIAAVYAHELGHILEWNFALMTLGTTVSQISYILYLFIEKLSHKNTKIKKFFGIIKITAIIPYLIYLINNYLFYYLSRNREDFADYFAAKVTGNPNGLSRALIKIPYGLLEEQKQGNSATLIALTRLLNIVDFKGSLICGNAYFLTSDFQQVGQTFLWDLFNPWRIWLKLNSSHPLTGKRIHTLMNYAQFLELENQFNTLAVIVQGNQLNHRKLYTNFILEILVFNAQWLGIIATIVVGFSLTSHLRTSMGIISLAMVGFGGGLLIKTLNMYPKTQNAPHTDIYSLICDPYASPLTKTPVELQGKLISQPQAIYELGANTIVQDSSGVIFCRYSSAFGSLGNFFLSWAKNKNFIGSNLTIVGWFRRGISPCIEWTQMNNATLAVSNYPRFWSVIRVSAVILVGLVLLIYAIGTHRLTSG
ncbi:M48 family metalloprotease [Gloeothece verrucosa]|uniref:Peptidase M48 Ste24p n=1 Tax=Gloeothece verrucosa (strain PCC 7822) TaxID=497965 RepID=E0UEH8_GLOV7|nr:M48 family metalloprotease [Gloeothece verrucosa]ADN15424.1 peptidase M48 Ste24p [Gloeothece verrucosa PCC 7822]